MSGSSGRALWRLLPILLIIAALFSLWLSTSREELDIKPRTVVLDELEESVEPQADIALVREDQQIMYYGIHVDKVYELSLQSRTFSADGFNNSSAFFFELV